ncbi:hypothetical protein Mapa_008158 [Marchantia paleacea]|nr:hypothetical protein Mapa_008158 [Marchantia paleacea]
MVREMQNEEVPQPHQKQTDGNLKAVPKQSTADATADVLDDNSIQQRQRRLRHVTQRLKYMSLGGITELSNHEITLWKRPSRTRSTFSARTTETRSEELAAAILELAGRSTFATASSQTEVDDGQAGRAAAGTDGLEQAKEKIKRLQRTVRTLRMEKARALSLLKRTRRERESAYRKLEHAVQTLKDRDRELVKFQQYVKEGDDARKLPVPR